MTPDAWLYDYTLQSHHWVHTKIKCFNFTHNIFMSFCEEKGFLFFFFRLKEEEEEEYFIKLERLPPPSRE